MGDEQAVTILVTDDDTATRNLYRDVLRSRGYAVEEAATGVQCVEQARRLFPALIILDLQMPIRDGFSAAAELRSDPATRSIPILAVSGLSRHEEIERAIRAGCDAVLNKPVAPHDLLEGVRALLETYASERVRQHAERQRRAAATLVAESYPDLWALRAPTSEVDETELRQWMQGAQVTICSFCSRVRLPTEWRSISPELLDFLERWTTLSHGICPDCLAREYPDSARHD